MTERDQMVDEPMTFGQAAREVIHQAVHGVCAYRGWRLWALAVRTNHVHVVVEAEGSPDRMVLDFKAYATRALAGGQVIARGRKVWTRHGSVRLLKDDESLRTACRYVAKGQGPALS